MKKVWSIIIVAIVIGGGFYLWKNYKGVLPAVFGPSGDIANKLPASDNPNLADAVNKTDFPLKLPKGFAISVLAKDLPGARVVALNNLGEGIQMFVSQTSEGKISELIIKDGQVIRQSVLLSGLNKPHGLALDDLYLYFAEEDKISRLILYHIADPPPEKLVDLPSGGRHFTRTLHFGFDGRLYVSIGSTCDVCNEKDQRIATIHSMNKDGSDFKKVASGLRNSVFMATNPVDGKIWATEMGRDNLGDNLPPDEINIIEEGKDYGWPYFYGKNIHDAKSGLAEPPVKWKVEPSYIDLPAHSAPLGLAFVPYNTLWPKEYWGDLIVAFHGSWNRRVPTGYKLARIKLDDQGNYEGMDATGLPQIEDFISGWLAADGKTSLGRPAGLAFGPNGSLFVSDDKAGLVYKIEPLISEIVVDVPAPNSIAASPLRIAGKAKGNWFFEAVFSVKLLDEDGSVLSQSHVEAQGEWTSEDFVEFEGKLIFNQPKGSKGTLVFENANPSGMVENKKSFQMPVNFK